MRSIIRNSVIIITLLLWVGVSVAGHAADSKKVTITRILSKPEQNDCKYDEEKYWKKRDNLDYEKFFPEDPKIDEYLKLEKEGKLPAHIVIYHNDQKARAFYHSLFTYDLSTKRMTYDFIDVIKDNIFILDNEIDFAGPFEEYLRIVNPIMIDFFLWLIEEGKKNNTSYIDYTPLCYMANVILIAPEYFKEEMEYFKCKVFPIFWQRIKDNKHDITELVTLYYYGYGDKVLPLIADYAKQQEVYFDSIYYNYFSFKKNVRVVEFITEFEHPVVELLSGPRIHWASQYSAVQYLQRIGKLKGHINLVFRIIDNKWFAPFVQKPTNYIPVLLKIKDEKIVKYFKKNMDVEMFADFKEEMKTYIRNFKLQEGKR